MSIFSILQNIIENNNLKTYENMCVTKTYDNNTGYGWFFEGNENDFDKHLKALKNDAKKIKHYKLYKIKKIGTETIDNNTKKIGYIEMIK